MLGDERFELARRARQGARAAGLCGVGLDWPLATCDRRLPSARSAPSRWCRARGRGRGSITSPPLQGRGWGGAIGPGRAVSSAEQLREHAFEVFANVQHCVKRMVVYPRIIAADRAVRLWRHRGCRHRSRRSSLSRGKRNRRCNCRSRAGDEICNQQVATTYIAPSFASKGLTLLRRCFRPAIQHASSCTIVSPPLPLP